MGAPETTAEPAMKDGVVESSRGGYRISTDPGRLDLDVIHAFLSGQSYWAKGVPRDVVEASLEGSCCFGLYLESDGSQVGFARVVTDYATFAYLADVFILAEHRGRGLSRWLVERVLAHPRLQGFRRWILATRDAHGVYAKLGFTPLDHPEIFMQIHRPDVHAEGPSSPRSGG